MTGPSDPLPLNGHGLTPAAVAEVARARRPVALDPAARARMAEARQVIERALESEAPVYGVTTGLGARVGHRLPREALAEFSRLTLRGRGHALGPPLAREAVRAIMAVRLNGLLLGGAGAAPGVAEALAGLLNAGLTPVVPSIGSVGAGELFCASMSACALNMVETIAEGEQRAVGSMEVDVAVYRDVDKPPGELSIYDAVRVRFEMWGVSDDDAQFLVKTWKQR